MSEPFPPRPSDGDRDLADLRALAARVGGASRPGRIEWETPPADLWDRIAAGADVEPVAPAPGAGGATVGRLDVQRARRLARARPGTWLLAAAAALVVVVAAGALLRSTTSHDTTVVAATELELLAGDTGEGRAELVERDGSLQLRLSATDVDAGDGFLEVWVIDTGVSQLVSLGPLRDDGIYTLPSGLDPTAFPIVDVSVEPIDGDPTHSGDSVLRGQLDF